MAKLTKKQRRERRKKKKVEYAKRKKLRLDKNKKKIKPWEPVKMKMFEVPNLLPPEVPKEKRLEIVRSIGAKAKKDLDEKYPLIERWFKDYDPLYILSFCSMYLLSHPEGIDPEATGSLDFYPHYLEIMQAFSLYNERSYLPKPLTDNAEKLQQEMKEIGDLMQLRLLDIPEDLKTDEDIQAHMLRTDMMSHTIGVRNWAYYYQMKKVIGDLSELIKEDFEKIHRIDPVKLMYMLFKLAEERNNLLNEHLHKVRSFAKKKNYKEMIEAYNHAFPENKRIKGDGIEKIWDIAGRKIKNLLVMLVCHSDLKIEKIYSFDLDHAVSLYGDETKREELKKVLDCFSYEFGDLKDYEKEHIILDNPVHHRPFIRTGENQYYSSIFGILPHLALGLLEDLISENEELRRNYSDTVKPKYLEDEIERLFKLHFPSAKIYRGSQWKDPANNKGYENDLLVVIDTFALVVEAKSGQITPPAKRGAPSRLLKTLKELIEEPSEQAHRFIAYLKNNKGQHTFASRGGKTYVIDSSKINYFIPIGITLAHLGIISSNLKKLIEAGITEKRISDLAPSISLTDLESIFELLPIEAEKIHYFARRREIEDHVAYEGDELDLLAFYLENGFNIGDAEYSGKFVMNIMIKSKELDPYFVGTHEGIDLPKPRLAMTKWWKDLLETIASRKPQNWLETSFILLNTTKEDQEKFEKLLEKLEDRIKTGKVDEKHNWVAFLSGPERRRFLIIGYPYITYDKEERNNVMKSILDSEDAKNTRGAVIIGININRDDYPYSVLASWLTTDLFDI